MAEGKTTYPATPAAPSMWPITDLIAPTYIGSSGDLEEENTLAIALASWSELATWP